ncbi:YhdP family protein [Xylophilus sp. GOD-11R]|uniref:YhdP family protein n=1 Tax=Xylophilus sp. GOD-11R TaxID=3089814 RepID=UPI00298C5F10|nr:YhdP family protein [Xylophilus sp. GOD-11R]WPB57124.1 YhdP family protein [Xylophilus sp. GOD-11R]
MTEPIDKKNPVRAWKAAAAVASGIFWSLLAAWLCVGAAWCAVHFWIVPRIADFRPRLEAEATRILGAPVRIGSLTARSGWLVPTFAVADVTVTDTAGRTALRLPLVVAALSPRSLLHLGFEQLYLEDPELDLRRDADGRLVVAGIALKPSQSPGSRGADWLFSQAEVVVKGGTLHWTDERTAVPPLTLGAVEVVLRNGPWRHDLRVEATPPADSGGRFTLVGRFGQPLLSLRPGAWRDWSGPLYLDMPGADVARLYRQAGDLLRQPVPAGDGDAPPGPLFGVADAAGRGSLRLWADLAGGGIVGAAADVAVDDLALRFADAPEALALQRLSGRLTGHRSDAGFDLATRGLAFSREDGYRWPGGNVALRHVRAGAGRSARTEITGDQLDLAALAGVARSLPLGAAAQRTLADRAPRGLLRSIDAAWDTPDEDGEPSHFRARGQVAGLALASRPPDSSRLAAAAAVEAAMRARDPHGHQHEHPPIGLPGVRGADVDFDFDERGGKAGVAIHAGALDFPGVFDETVVLMDSLQADLRWQRGADGRMAVQAPQVTFANADAAGQLRATWHTADDGDPALRMPGVLDLSGSLSRADGTRVHRYLPRTLGPEVREYVRDAVSAGVATAVDFQVRGDLRHMPFADPKLGRFHIAAKLRDVTYAYAPPEIEQEGALPWPALVKLDGELVFEGRTMEIRRASGRLESPDSMRATGARGPIAPPPRTAATPPLLPGEVQVLRADVKIADLTNTVVEVQARARGPLAEMLAIVDAAPLAGITGHVLSEVSATGPAELQLGLTLPIHDMHNSRVRGRLALAGNDLRIRPATPLLAQATGAVAFTEAGFNLVGTQARMLGGEMRLEGGLKPVPGTSTASGAMAHVLDLRAEGSLTADGLRGTPELGATARLAKAAQGEASYTATVDTSRGHPEVLVTSSLQGMALNLPAPMGKSADASLPLRFQTRLLPAGDAAAARDELTMRLGDVVAVRYMRSLDGEQPRVMAGSMDVGSDAGAQRPLPDEGVAANVRLAVLDVDAWREVLRQVGEEGPEGRSAAAAPTTPKRSEAADYLPDTLALRAGELTAAGRTLHDVVIGGTHQGNLWQANVDAREVGGFVEYRQSAGTEPARFFARLSRLEVPDTAAQDVESLTDQSGPESTSPTGGPLPALDIVVDDFQLKERHLGRLEVQAVNRDTEWRLDKLQLTMPEASFAATGRWGRRAAGAARRTDLDFRLDLRDSGALLARFGMPGVVARGAGQLQGKVDWQGSPFSPEYRSMDGTLRLDVASGQFLKADPGLAKLLGVLSLQSLPRRLTLDFRDVFSDGFAFDHVRGDVRIDDGIARTDRLEMKGVAATVRMDGSADLRRETQDLRVVVVPEINAGTASLLATFVNPVIGLGTFLAQALLRGPLIDATTQEFDISGRWVDPKIVKLSGKERTETR